jgi:hypothetical protein
MNRKKHLCGKKIYGIAQGKTISRNVAFWYVRTSVFKNGFVILWNRKNRERTFGTLSCEKDENGANGLL